MDELPFSPFPSASIPIISETGQKSYFYFPPSSAQKPPSCLGCVLPTANAPGQRFFLPLCHRAPLPRTNLIQRAACLLPLRPPLAPYPLCSVLPCPTRSVSPPPPRKAHPACHPPSAPRPCAELPFPCAFPRAANHIRRTKAPSPRGGLSVSKKSPRPAALSSFLNLISSENCLIERERGFLPLSLYPRCSVAELHFIVF